MGNCIKLAEESQEVQEVQSVSQQLSEAPRKTTVPKLKKVMNHRLFARRKTQKEGSKPIGSSPYDEAKRSAACTASSVTN